MGCEYAQRVQEVVDERYKRESEDHLRDIGKIMRERELARKLEF